MRVGLDVLAEIGDVMLVSFGSILSIKVKKAKQQMAQLLTSPIKR